MPDSAREAALNALVRCTRDAAWTAEALDNEIKNAGLDRRDAALSSRLCLGVLQNETLLDHYIAAYCSLPLNRLERRVHLILRLGAYQILFLDRVPDRAAVNEAVSMCAAAGCVKATGLVNAVLRRIAENKNELPEIPGKGSAEYLNVKYSHPLWLCRRFIDLIGYDRAENLLSLSNQPPPLTLQVNTLRSSVTEYEKKLALAGIEYETTQGGLIIQGGQAIDLPGFSEGLFYVQDGAAHLSVAVAGAKSGMRVLDACSAPGGKSYACAIAMENSGYILASDIHDKKLALVRAGAKRLGIRIIECAAADARNGYEGLESDFDLVIADVPCSGLGVIRKKPEIRRKRPEDLERLPQIQSAILASVSRYVRPGGALLYSTCTLLPEENEAVVQAFLKAHSEFQAEDFSLGSIRSSGGCYTFWPDRDGTDGFFAALMRRAE